MPVQPPTEPDFVIRPGGIADVTHVARLLEAATPGFDLDGDGVVDVPGDPDLAASVARLSLSHVVLQHGHLWVAERDGIPVAASVWIPPAAMSVAGETLREIVARELDAAAVASALAPGENVRQALVTAAPQVTVALEAIQPDLLVTGLAASPTLPPEVRGRLLRECLASALSTSEGTAAALTLVPEHAEALIASGFVQVGSIPVGTKHEMWVGRAR